MILQKLSSFLGFGFVFELVQFGDGMTRIRTSYFRYFAVVATLVISNCLFAEVKTGDPYPDFVLPRIDNRKPVSLSDYRGKKVLLIQFASW